MTALVAEALEATKTLAKRLYPQALIRSLLARAVVKSQPLWVLLALWVTLVFSATQFAPAAEAEVITPR